MNNKSPAFQFYPSEFLTDENIINMTFEEKGIYISLICHCWINGSLPNHFGKLNQLLNKNGFTKRDKQLLNNVLEGFGVEIIDGEERIIHQMIEREKNKQASWKRHKENNENS